MPLVNSSIASMPNNRSPYKLANYQLLTIDNPVFCCFLLWSSVLIIKMLLMSLLTGLQRFRFKAFSNEEDLAFFKNRIDIKMNEPHVERVRRAHLNDLENILPYFVMALFYICTDPDPIVACVLFRIAVIGRIIYTLIYAFGPVKQPTRALMFYIMFIITIYMACTVALQMLNYI